MSKLRGAVLGCGMIAEFHLRGWNRIPEVEIVALANRTVSRAEERRDRFAPAARVYRDPAEMIARERLDFIDILTIPGLHREHVLMARDAGLHIICQKPLCDTLEDARRLVAEMRGYSKVFAVHENHRYRPWFRGVLERHAEAFFGRPSMARFEHLNATHPGEVYKNEAGTGVFLEYGSHLVDMMRGLLGPPRRVFARMHRLNAAVRGESLVHAVYEYDDATAVVEAGWKAAAITQGSVLVAGNAGEAFYEGTLTRGERGRFRVTRGAEVVLDEERCPYNDYVESFYLLERECVDAMLGRRAVTQTGAEHLRTLAATFAAYESAATGRVVEIQAETE